jgi:phage terminase large subunit-like protein
MKTKQEIEQLAEQYWDKQPYNEDAYFEGYTQCQEDNKDKKYTEEPLKEMSLNEAIEFLKQNHKESVKVTLSEDERNDINDFFKNYEVKRKYKQ